MSNIDTEVAGSVETVEQDFGLKPGDVVKRWTQEIDLFERHSKVKSWQKVSRDIIRKLRRETEGSNDLDKEGFNLLWANIDTERAALYNKRPQPVVTRRQKTGNKAVTCASEILERNTEYQIDCDDNYFDEVISDCISDWQGPGWGWSWVVYKPQFKMQRTALIVTDMGMADEAGQMYDPEGVQQDEQGFYIEEEALDYEEAKVEYVAWDEVGLSLTRRWRDVRAVWRKHQMTREECIDKFGEEIGNEIPLSLCEVKSDKDQEELGPVVEMFKRAQVYEIWDKNDKQIVWVCPDYKEQPCLVEEDKLKLKNFFPCPRPLMMGTTTDSMIPVPQTVQYWGLLAELEKVNVRITKLIPTIKVGGATSAKYADKLNQMFSLPDGQYLALDNFTEFMANQQGLQGVISEIPIDKNIVAVSTLIDYRAKILEQIYEVRGISDLMRGHSNPSETATAQRYKMQQGQVRLTPRQREVQRFCRDTMALVAEVLANVFTNETLLMGAGDDIMQRYVDQQQPLDPQHVVREALALLKDEDFRNFRIEIETDSLLAADEAAEKQAMVEAFQTINEGLTAALPAMQMAPELAELEAELMKQIVRTFRGSRHLEGVAERAFEGMSQRIQQAAQQPKQDPKAVAAQQAQQQKAAAEMQKTQLAARKMQQDAQMQIAKLQQEAQAQSAKLELERQKLIAEHQLEKEKMTAEIRQAQTEAAVKAEIEVLKLQSQEMQSQLKEAQAGQALAQKEAATKQESQPQAMTLNVAPSKKKISFGGKEVTIETMPEGGE